MWCSRPVILIEESLLSLTILILSSDDTDLDLYYSGYLCKLWYTLFDPSFYIIVEVISTGSKVPSFNFFEIIRLITLREPDLLISGLTD